MFARDRTASRSLSMIAIALVAWLAPAPAARGGETVVIGDLTFVNQALVGVGRLPADLRDKFGETFGSGSAIAVDPKSWVRTPAGYQGTFYMLPDRGFNVTGTSDYRARINKLSITFKPLDDPAAVPIAQRQSSVAATLADTILLTDAVGQSLTGLDPVGIRGAANGLPALPQASNGRVSIDSESLALLSDGGFFIGDEYGPYIYRSRRPAACWRRSGRPRRSCPSARVRITSLPIIPVQARKRPTRRTRKPGGRTTRVSKG
jgi:hypothetical protein